MSKNNNNYLNHYARTANIDIYSESSMKNWYEGSEIGLKLEIDQFTKNIEQRSVLELGCGVGNLLFYLKKKGCTKYIGVDSSEAQLEICKKYVTKNVVKDDALHFLETTNEKYDFIILFDLIEHLKKQDITKLLQLIYGNLNDNGVVLIRTPNMSSFTGLHSRYIDFTHEVGFTEESLHQIIADNNFQNISLHNAYLGKRRKFVMNILYWMIYRLHFLNRPKIMTSNIIAYAIKSYK